MEHIERALVRSLVPAMLSSVPLSIQAGSRSVPPPAPPRGSLARAAQSREGSGGRRVAPCTTSNPARCQAIVPSFSNMILLRKAGVTQRLGADDAAGAAAAIDDHRRVGRQHHVGEAVDQLCAGYADRGRDGLLLSYRRTTGCRRSAISAPLSISGLSGLGAEIQGVPASCSTTSAKALLGTLTPENSSRPASAHAATPPLSTRQIGVAEAAEDRGARARRARRRRRTARCGSRAAAPGCAILQLEPAERQRAGVQQVCLARRSAPRAGREARARGRRRACGQTSRALTARAMRLRACALVHG